MYSQEFNLSQELSPVPKVEAKLIQEISQRLGGLRFAKLVVLALEAGLTTEDVEEMIHTAYRETVAESQGTG